MSGYAGNRDGKLVDKIAGTGLRCNSLTKYNQQSFRPYIKNVFIPLISVTSFGLISWSKNQ